MLYLLYTTLQLFHKKISYRAFWCIMNLAQNITKESDPVRQKHYTTKKHWLVDFINIFWSILKLFLFRQQRPYFCWYYLYWAAHNSSNYLNRHCFVRVMLFVPVWNGDKVSYLSVPLGYRMWQKKESKLELAASMIRQVMPEFHSKDRDCEKKSHKKRTGVPFWIKPGHSQSNIFCHFREKYRNTYKIKCYDKGLKTADSSTSLSFIKL